MPKINTCISINADLKKEAQELYADLGLDLSTVVTLLLKESLCVQWLPFRVTRKKPAEASTKCEAYAGSLRKAQPWETL